MCPILYGCSLLKNAYEKFCSSTRPVTIVPAWLTKYDEDYYPHPENKRKSVTKMRMRGDDRKRNTWHPVVKRAPEEVSSFTIRHSLEEWALSTREICRRDRTAPTLDTMWVASMVTFSSIVWHWQVHRAWEASIKWVQVGHPRPVEKLKLPVLMI
jgi:hypothetical protein